MSSPVPRLRPILSTTVLPQTLAVLQRQAVSQSRSIGSVIDRLVRRKLPARLSEILTESKTTPTE